MPREGDDVDPEGADVHGAVRHQLGAVDHRQHAPLAGGGRDGPQVGQPAGDVAAAGDRQDAGPRVLVQRGLYCSDVEGALPVDVHDPQLRVPLPGQQVRVVLHAIDLGVL